MTPIARQSLFQRFIIFAFNLVYKITRWFDRRFTQAGKFVVSVLIISAALGIDTRLNVTHQIFTLSAALLLLSLIWAPFFRSRYSVERALPRYGSVDETLEYQLVIANQQQKPLYGLEFSEDFNTSPLSAEHFFGFHTEIEKRLNWFDRMVGYPRWASLMRKRAGAKDIRQPLENIPAGESRRINMKLQPLRRGYLNFSRCALARTDPLGLFRARVTNNEADRVLILPKRYRVPIIDLPGSRRFQQGGVTLASEVGESDEFVSMRDYRPGDPLRHVHWKSLAKTGKPVVKQYQDEYFSRHALVLDTYTRQPDHPAFEAAISVAASFAAAIDTNESLLDLLFVGNKATRVTAGRSLGSADQFLEVLSCISPSSHHDFTILTRSVTAQRSRMSGCICVFLDWDQERQDLIKHLRAVKVPCRVLVVSDRSPEDTLELGPMAGEPDRLHLIHPETIEQDLAKL